MFLRCILVFKKGGVIHMNERLKKLRKALDLTQQEFADRIGIKRNSFANYETGRNTPIDAIIISICREFNVSEDWLRDGIGDMFLPTDRNADIAKLTKQLLNEENDSFKNRFVSMLANLTIEEWEFLERKAKELCGMDDKDKKPE
ncbi:MAG: helix-turn-helix domain protein [Bacteriophage sp.]|nr:MAG: helix-turn-helix domain protein [Bacteriophage sp.]DAE64166.1 MAG TPA: Repressor protein CI [Caudoviricetes sp.]